jgi:hypothetical protein
MQGARRTGTGMYALVHEDREHRATRQFARTMNFYKCPLLKLGTHCPFKRLYGLPRLALL